MSDEYTPTIEEVRLAWSWNGTEAADAEFDRWLTAHDAQVKADAWHEGLLACWHTKDEKHFPVNPYRRSE